MLPIALLITIMGIMMLLLGLRGRVAQLGTLCLRCTFDHVVTAAERNPMIDEVVDLK